VLTSRCRDAALAAAPRRVRATRSRGWMRRHRGGWSPPRAHAAARERRLAPAPAAIAHAVYAPSAPPVEVGADSRSTSCGGLQALGTTQAPVLTREGYDLVAAAAARNQGGRSHSSCTRTARARLTLYVSRVSGRGRHRLRYSARRRLGLLLDRRTVAYALSGVLSARTARVANVVYKQLIVTRRAARNRAAARRITIVPTAFAGPPCSSSARTTSFRPRSRRARLRAPRELMRPLLPARSSAPAGSGAPSRCRGPLGKLEGWRSRRTRPARDELVEDVTSTTTSTSSAPQGGSGGVRLSPEDAAVDVRVEGEVKNRGPSTSTSC